jgi:hypothetical protein
MACGTVAHAVMARSRRVLIVQHLLAWLVKGCFLPLISYGAVYVYPDPGYGGEGSQRDKLDHKKSLKGGEGLQGCLILGDAQFYIKIYALYPFFSLNYIIFFS